EGRLADVQPRAVHSELDRLAVAAALALLADECDGLLHPHLGHALRQPAVATPRRASQRSRRRAADPDRRSRLLQRTRTQTAVANLPGRPVVLGVLIEE